MTKPIFIGHDIYRDSTYGSGHPLAIPRVSLAIDLARAMGWFDAGNYRESPMAGFHELSDFHTPDYLQALEAAETEPPDADVQKRFNIGANGNPVFREMFRRPATACGGGLLATALLKNNETTVVYNIAGGQHHGMPSYASGFCYLNEPALTIRRLKKLGARRVFYLDLDAHFGDGVQWAFKDDNQVFTLSIHEQGKWPQSRTSSPGEPGTIEDRAGGQARNLPVPQELNDTEFAFLIDQVALPLMNDFNPDVVYLQGGCDALADDPQSKLALSNGALWEAVQKVKDQAPRLIVSGGGGYNPYSVGRCWAGIWASLNGIDIPGTLNPAAQDVLSGVKWNHRQGRVPLPSWLSTLRDVPNEGPVRDDIKVLVKKALAG